MGAEIGVTSLPLFVPPSAGGLTSATVLSALAQSQRLRVAARASRRPKHRADSARLPPVTADIACTVDRGPAQVGRLPAVRAGREVIKLLAVRGPPERRFCGCCLWVVSA